MDDTRLERLLDDVLADIAAEHVPDLLGRDIALTTSHVRQRPRWLALIKEPPMHLHARVAVGSPAVRLAYLAILTLLMTILATGAVVAGASLLPTPAIVVAQDGSGTYRTINEAVAVAQDGDTVLVKPGTYLESIAITEDITLRGDGGRGAVIMDFATSGPTHAFDAGPFAYGILLVGSDANVDNITLHGRPDGAGETPLSAVVIDGGAPVLEQLDVLLGDEPFPDYPFFMRSAFQVIGGSTAVVRDSSWDGYLRVIDPTSAPTFEGNTISSQIVSIWDGDPVIRRNTLREGASIAFGGSTTRGTAEDNDIIDGWITIGEGAHPTIRHNQIRQPHVPDASTGERGAAVRISIGSSPIVEGNTITDSAYGVEVMGFGANPQITANSISGSISAAIVVQNGPAPTVDGNTIEKNTTGIEVIGGSAPVITGNKLCENGIDLKVPEGSTLTLAGNTMCTGARSPAP